MAVNFGDLDKVESAANVCKRSLALYLERHSNFWRLTDMTTKRDEDIDLESGEYTPVSRILKFDLDFGGNGNF